MMIPEQPPTANEEGDKEENSTQGGTQESGINGGGEVKIQQKENVKLTFGTFNIRTANDKKLQSQEKGNRLPLLAKVAEKEDIDILGIQETLIAGRFHTKFRQPLKYQVFGDGVPDAYETDKKFSASKAMKKKWGVGIMIRLDKSRGDKVTSVHYCGPRLIWLTAKVKGVNILAVSAYAPHSGTDREVCEEFYNVQMHQQIQQARNLYPHHELIVMGDFNAAPGSDDGRNATTTNPQVMGAHLPTATAPDANGARLRHWFVGFNMVIINSFFPMGATWHNPGQEAPIRPQKTIFWSLGRHG